MSLLTGESDDCRLHPGAKDDLSSIVDYYLLRGNPDAAERVNNAIFDIILSPAPLEVRYRGHRRHDLTDRPLLFVNVYEYLIAYAPEENPVHILAVLHGRREPQVLSSLLDERH